MNILIPDSWLREHLKTDATPKQIKDCLSLSGPSIERIHTSGKEIVYDVEVTTNRVDMYSVRGIAREASVILPEFGISATLLPMSTIDLRSRTVASKPTLDIRIKNDESLCQRILAITIENITLDASPPWLTQKLEHVGARSLNNAIDITNYVMWEIGHPIHAFDYDLLQTKRIVVRVAKKNETLVTLDGKKHHLQGGEIVFDDGTGTIIDLPGIMGTANTVVNEKTKNVLLLIESSDAVRIRKASMGLAIRTQAAVINEKHPDPELAYETLSRAVYLYQEVTRGHIGSNLCDIYTNPEKPARIEVSPDHIERVIGSHIQKDRIETILTHLGCSVVKAEKTNNLTVIPPSWRIHDMIIPEDVIEEIARIYGYHNIPCVIPGTHIQPKQTDSRLVCEKEIKTRLRDWGYTEIYSYSMISERLMKLCGFDISRAYYISNPLSDDLVYMRPDLLPSMLSVIEKNLHSMHEGMLFELAHVYRATPNNELPLEEPHLLVAWTGGDQFARAKGLWEALAGLYGVSPGYGAYMPSSSAHLLPHKSLQLGRYGYLGTVGDIAKELGITTCEITILDINIQALVDDHNPIKSYTPLSKYPAAIEDIAFIVPYRFQIGPFIDAVASVDPLVREVTLIDSYHNTKTVRITYADPDRNLTAAQITPVRGKILTLAKEKFNALLKE